MSHRRYLGRVILVNRIKVSLIVAAILSPYPPVSLQMG